MYSENLSKGIYLPKSPSLGQRSEGANDLSLYQMNSVRVGSKDDDYLGSLHHKITENLKY